MFVERREREWSDLQNRALYLLENVEQLAPREPIRGLHPVLRLWVYPSYESYTAWTIFRTIPNAAPELTIVRLSAWDRPFDSRRLREPLEGAKNGFSTEPTFEVRDAVLSPEDVAKLHLERKFTISLTTARDVVGLDGTSSGLHTYGFLGGVRLSWWQNGPQEWRELITWSAEIRMFLTELFSHQAD